MKRYMAKAEKPLSYMLYTDFACFAVAHIRHYTKVHNMAKKPTGNPNGRPLTQLNSDVFEGCCRILCTKDEICDIFQIDEKTLTAWCKRTYGCGFSEIYKKLSANGKMSLRRYQFDLAENNATMAIWLGKQWLGQTDEVKLDHGNNELLTALTDLARKQMNND